MSPLSRSITALLAVVIVAGMLASPAVGQDYDFDVESKDNGTTVQTTEIGNTTFRTTITADGTTYRSSRTQIGNSTFYRGTSSDGWSYSGSSYDFEATSFSNTTYYDDTGGFTGSSSTTTFDTDVGSTTIYEGFDGSDYDTETIINFDSNY